MNKIEENIFERINFWMPRLIALWKTQFAGFSGNAKLTDKDFNEISSGVKELSRGLTGDRAKAGTRYLAEASGLGAYLLYFWPVSYAQTRMILHLNNMTGSSALDLGAGPGPCTIAMIDHGFKSVTACERVRGSTALLKKLASFTKGSVLLKELDVQKNVKGIEGRFDLIYAGHLINELWKDNDRKITLRSDFVTDIMNYLKRDGRLCILEPALTSTSRDLIKLRNELVKKNISVISPCINKKECLIINDGDSAACHSEYDWKVNPVVKRLAGMAGIKKDTLKFSYLLINKSGITSAADRYIVVSDKLISKSGKTRFFICGREGRISLSLSEKDKELFRGTFLKLKRGDIITLKNCEPRDNGLMLTQGCEIIKIK